MNFSQHVEIIKQNDGAISIAADSDTLTHITVTFMELRHQYEAMAKWMQDKTVPEPTKEPYVQMYKNYAKSLNLLSEIMKAAGMTQEEIIDLKIPV